jgi:hypothetical protein
MSFTPGFTDPATRYDRPQIVAKDLAPTAYIPIVVTGADFAAGTVMGKITASGKYENYDDLETNGAEDAVGIITEDANALAGDVTTRLLVSGMVFNDKLTGSDAAAEADLFARQITQADGTVLLKL